LPAPDQSATSVAHPDPKRDAALERRAMVERWPIKDEYREPMLNRQISIALNAESNKESTSAFRAVLTAESQNIEIEKMVRGVPDSQVNNQLNVQVNLSDEDLAARIVAYLAASGNPRTRAGAAAGGKAGSGASTDAEPASVDAVAGAADGGVSQPGG
jgi:hypothetical protein